MSGDNTRDRMMYHESQSTWPYNTFFQIGIREMPLWNMHAWKTGRVGPLGELARHTTRFRLTLARLLVNYVDYVIMVLVKIAKLPQNYGTPTRLFMDVIVKSCVCT